ncbi:MAG: hypothetical protein Q7K43_00425 [Candidatus Woesearchaeota archaeon]|nr:hypothetical protein [Candidatus Woesearchaeota archaeon]
MNTLIKAFSGTLAFVVVLLLTLHVLGIVSWQTFWLIIILVAGFAYLLLPHIQRGE